MSHLHPTFLHVLVSVVICRPQETQSHSKQSTTNNPKATTLSPAIEGMVGMRALGWWLGT